jgi:hypothetical protein
MSPPNLRRLGAGQEDVMDRLREAMACRCMSIRLMRAAMALDRRAVALERDQIAAGKSAGPLAIHADAIGPKTERPGAC